jgi:hydroxymethylpyrimidine/phosphomethylpyrimidine kinase
MAAAHDDADCRHHRGLGFSGGAGIQADLKTFSALGVYGASVITLFDGAEHQGRYCHSRGAAGFRCAQLDAVFSDLAVGAVKIGMLGNAAVIAAVAAGLERHGQTNVVLDPVMAATSGRRPLAGDAIEALRTQLLPRALVITDLPRSGGIARRA